MGNWWNQPLYLLLFTYRKYKHRMWSVIIHSSCEVNDTAHEWSTVSITLVHSHDDIQGMVHLHHEWNFGTPTTLPLPATPPSPLTATPKRFSTKLWTLSKFAALSLKPTNKGFTYIYHWTLKCSSQGKPAAPTSHEHLGVQLLCSYKCTKHLTQ